MGFYSYACAKTGLPILAGQPHLGERENVASHAVLLMPNGDRLTGVYDGFGNLGSHEIGDLMDSQKGKLVLKHFYKGEGYDQLGKSRPDPAQGCDEHLLVMSGHEIIEGGHSGLYDAHVLEPGKWDKCRDEMQALNHLMGADFEQRFGVSMRDIRDLMEHMESELGDEPDESANWKRLWDREIAPKWDLVPDTSPLKTLPAVAAVHALDGVATLLDNMARTEALHAWRENKIARIPNFEALLANPQDPKAWIEESALEESQRLMRARRASMGI